MSVGFVESQFMRGHIFRNGTYIKMFMLVAVGLVACVILCSCVALRNKYAATEDLLTYICTTGPNLNEWAFSPDTIDWTNASQVYRVEFSPLRARRHRVFIEYDTRLPENKQLETKQMERFLSNVKFRMSVYHYENGNPELFDSEQLTKFSTWWYCSKDGSRIIRVDLKEFYPARYPWYFKDKLLLSIEVFNEGSLSVRTLNGGNIKVGEFYPLY